MVCTIMPKIGFDITVSSVNIQVFSSILFATDMQQPHSMIDTLHSIMNNQAAQSNMSEAKQKISLLLIMATVLQCTYWKVSKMIFTITVILFSIMTC